MRRLAALRSCPRPLLSIASPAFADASLVLSDIQVDASLRTVDLTVAAKDLPAGSGLDPASVEATVDGRRLPTGSVVAAETTETAACQPCSWWSTPAARWPDSRWSTPRRPSAASLLRRRRPSAWA